MRQKKFVDLPVTKEIREFVKLKKGSDSYDKFFRNILDYSESGDET